MNAISQSDFHNARLQSLHSLLAAFKAELHAIDKATLASKKADALDENPRIQPIFRQLCDSMNTLLSEGSDLSTRARNDLGEALQREMLPYLCLTEVAERFYSKPRGYAGDAQTIQQIYMNRPGGSGRIGPLLDACFLAEPAARAVRNRRALLARRIQQEMNRRPDQTTHITSLACGPAQEVFDAFEHAGAHADLHAHLIDMDLQALGDVQGRAANLGLSQSISTHRLNLLQVASGRRVLPVQGQHLIYSIGLIDYFDDDTVVALINASYDQLQTDGALILGNFHPRNSSKALMDHVLDWKLIHRDESHLSGLFARSKFGKPACHIHVEEEGINLFAECRKVQ
jgi:extracellular factor (EF) 3-hydroxypalmitic acid methyl ester biosynthesis protein